MIMPKPITIAAMLTSAKGEYDRAIVDFNKAIQLKPDFDAAYNNRGLAYHDKDDYDRAIVDFNTAIKLKPNFAAPYSNRGNGLQW